jgi:hypothetical protein
VDHAAELSLYHLMNHLATIKLAVGLLERRAHLTAAEHVLAETAIHAADALTTDLAAGPLHRSGESP